MTISVHAGPEFLFSRWQIAFLGTGFQRWFGNALYNNGAGGRIVASYALMPRLIVRTSADIQALSYEIGSDQSGAIASLSLRASYTISPSSIVQLAGGLGSRDAKTSAFGSTTHWFGLGYYRDLPFGFSAYVEPNFTRIRYHAPLVGFGTTRKDKIFSIRAELLNRRIEYAGFAPKLTFVYANQSSTIPLFDYGRSQFSIGFTRQF